MLVLTILLLIGISQTAWSARADLNLMELNQNLETLLRINQEYSALCGEAIALMQKPSSCSEISDNFCTTLWSSQNRGSMKVMDGAILQAKSEKAGIAAYVLADYQALVHALPNLAPDLQKALAPGIGQLKEVLAHESDSPEWADSLSDALFQIDEAKMAVEKARVEARLPATSNWDTPLIKDPKRKLAIDRTRQGLRDEILSAKYAKSENWHRVETTFAEAKADVAKAIADQNLPAEIKKRMLEKIATVKLALPLAKYSEEEDCGTTQVNGFYMPAHHVFTVCAGMFNSLQSAGSLYGVIAHEIGHSIDNSACTHNQWRLDSPVAKIMGKLEGAKGPVYSCEDWSRQKAVLKARAARPGRDAKPVAALDKLYACLQSREDIENSDPHQRAASVVQIVRRGLSKFADDNIFTSLGDPSLDPATGERGPNYMRPDLWYLAANGAEREKLMGTANEAEVFTQALACQGAILNGKKVPYEEAPREEQAKLFKEAIKETKSVLAWAMIDKTNYCGEACPELASFGLAVNPQENFADWVSFKAMKYRLERAAVGTRQETAALASAPVCVLAGDKKVSGDFMEMERKFSTRVHPDDRVRRLSLFNKENAALAGCLADSDGKKGYSSCEI